RAGPPRTYLCRRLPLADDGRRRPEGRWLPRASCRVDRGTSQAPPGDGALGGRSRARPKDHRRRRIPPHIHRRDASRRAEPRETRPVRHLHDVDPFGRHASPEALAAQRKASSAELADRVGALWEIARPFSFTASTVPVAAGGALAALAGAFNPLLFLASLIGAVALHVGTNVTNEIYDVRKGVDTIVSPRASHAIVKGRISDSDAYRFAIAAFAIALLMGIVLTLVRGLPIVVLGIIGLIGGYTYTAPPFQYKFGPIGIPIVFLLMGPLMVIGTFYAVTGTFDARAVAASVPVGL